MPVKVAGPRIYSSIKFHHLAHGANLTHRASNLYINVTPLVDLMTVLVTFLLMVFSASGQILQAAKGLELPVAAQQAELQEAPIVMVTSQGISVIIQDQHSSMPQTKDLATIASLLENPPPTMMIDSLLEILKSSAENIKNAIAPLKQDGKGGKGYTKDQIIACQREDDKLPAIIKNKVKIICPDGLAIVQADKLTDARIINMVVNTARQAGFEKLLFAVKYQATK
jgi:biopolymer transport protein ExbD